MTTVALRLERLLRFVNGRPPMLGEVGVRDPDYPCETYDGRGYDGTGRCDSDGHYLCTGCSHLAYDAPRFLEHGRGGRRDRLLLFWARHGREGLGSQPVP